MERAGSLIGKLKLSPEVYDPETRARAAWALAAGKKIAAHTLASALVRGTLVVEDNHSRLEVHAGQAVRVAAGEWVRYSSPGTEGAEYIAVCVPAFSPATVHRDPEAPGTNRR